MQEVKAMLASWARTALSAALTLQMAGVTDPKKLGYAALTAVIPPVLRWLNPNDAGFGRKS